MIDLSVNFKKQAFYSLDAGRVFARVCKYDDESVACVLALDANTGEENLDNRYLSSVWDLGAHEITRQDYFSRQTVILERRNQENGMHLN